MMGNQTSIERQRSKSPDINKDSASVSSSQGTSAFSTIGTARFDSKSVVGDILVSSDGKTVYRGSSKSGEALVLLNQNCIDGVYEWKFIIEDDSGASTCLGVASLPLSSGIRETDIFQCASFRLCRSYSGQLYDRGTILDKKVVPFWQSGTSVVFLLDMVAGTLTFSTNGNRPTEIFRGITGPIAPLVVFYASFSKRITLVEFKQLPYKIVEQEVKQSSTQSPLITIRSVHKTPEELLQLCTRIVDVRFNEKTCDGQIEVSPDCLTLSRSEEMHGGAYCLLNRRITSGVAAWEFAVHIDAGASSLVGVASEGIQMPPNNCSLFLSPYLSVWRSYEGRVYHKGVEVTECVGLLDWSTDCHSIGVMVDMNEGRMYFTCDGHIMSVVVTEICGPVYPVVGFYAGMPKCISLSQYREAIESDDTDSSTFSEQSKMSFEHSMLTGSAQVTNNGNTLVCNSGDMTTSYCVIDYPCRRGVYTWTVIIEQDKGATTCIGLTGKPIDVPDGRIYESQSMWLCRSYQGQLYEKGMLLAHTIDSFWESDTVLELAFDADRGEMRISKDGKNYGVVFTGIPIPVHLIVAFYSVSEKRVSLIDYKHTIDSSYSTSGLELNNLSPTCDNHTEGGDSGALMAVKQPEHLTSGMCLVCRMCPINTYLHPCGHSSTCWDDADHLVQSSGGCPICGVRVVAGLNQL